MEDDGDDKDDTKRRTRNLSEKKRRDQFNMLVNELSMMVSTNNRKLDKSSVLKSTISFLKNHNEITERSRAHDVQEDWKPTFLSNEEFTFLVMEALEGFVMVLSSNGIINYVSESVSSLLGHNPTDLVNKSIFDITNEGEQPNLYALLRRNVASTDAIQSVSKDSEMVKFEIHLQRGPLDFGTETSYELVTFKGYFRTNMELRDNLNDTNHPHDVDSRVLFVCSGRLHTPQLIRDVSLRDTNRNEFTSRHSLEWKFLFLDHRAPPIIGYLPFEVLGTSGYDYYHFDDLEKVVTCHEALMEKGELTSCYYRFLTKGQQWIWLQTRFYITYHQWNSKPEFVVCTHRVVSNSDIAKTTKEESAEENPVGEAKVNQEDVKETPSEDASMATMSPSYMSETNDGYASSYQHSHVETSQRSLKDTPSDDATMAPMSPSFMSEASYPASYRSNPQAESSRRTARGAHSDDMAIAPMSPSYMSEASEPYGNSHRTHSRAASVKSASSASGTVASSAWVRTARHRYGSDSGSVSGESRASSRHRGREKRQQHQLSCYDHCNVMMFQPGHKGPEPALVPQHGIGAQFLDPAPYMGAVAMPAVLPLPTMPVIVAQDHAQIQEQLQRKHEELQEMIERQQEELRQVKEQLLLARLGIMQPLINVSYADPQEMQHQQGAPARAQLTYPPTQPPHPPHPPGPHHMPQ